jgi:DeoR/GlpR family transcriptional regulator of sugar metabolism
VSHDTVRRDLDHLQRHNLLLRTHGGALWSAPAPAVEVVAFSERETKHAEAKERIGRAAAALIADGETLLVNAGTTTLAFARCLDARHHLVVVTNNIKIPTVLSRDVVREIYILGGAFRFEYQATVGPVGFLPSSTISVDTAVIGSAGLSVSAGISSTDLIEGQMMAQMITAATRTIILVDSGKFNRNAFAHVAPLADIDILVTDEEPPEQLREALEAESIDIIIAR